MLYATSIRPSELSSTIWGKVDWPITPSCFSHQITDLPLLTGMSVRWTLTNLFISHLGFSKSASCIDHQAGSNAGFLCGKQTTFEGGMRLPAIAWWPGKIEAGKSSHQITKITDLFPTLLDLAGIDPPDNVILDGTSIKGFLLDGNETDRLVWDELKFQTLNDLISFHPNVLSTVLFSSIVEMSCSLSETDSTRHTSGHGATSYGNGQMALTSVQDSSWKEWQPIIRLIMERSQSSFTWDLIHKSDFLSGKILRSLYLLTTWSEKMSAFKFHCFSSPNSATYREQIGIINAIKEEFLQGLVPAEPQLNWCDRAVMVST